MDPGTGRRKSDPTAHGTIALEDALTSKSGEDLASHGFPV